MTWPFKCEAEAWDLWSCVADTMIALPAKGLRHFRATCLGTMTCHPEAHGDSAERYPDYGGKRVKNEWV